MTLWLLIRKMAVWFEKHSLKSRKKGSLVWGGIPKQATLSGRARMMLMGPLTEWVG
jgi:hypothetical protein